MSGGAIGRRSVLIAAIWVGLAVPAAALGARGIPAVRPDHPGNVYLLGERVNVRIPDDVRGKYEAWSAHDIDGVRVSGGGRGENCSPGALPIGWYRISFRDANGSEVGWTTAAVIAALGAPVPENSPICVDSATSWFARDDASRREGFAYLASLAGVNWIRDRLSWDVIETARGTFAPPTTIYDESAKALAGSGLNVLQVFHGTPHWALDRRLDGSRSAGRFPRDLRDIHRFIGAAAARFTGLVRAWEPWNEANIEPFGGHTIDEMCALQKAAYLGAKRADANVIVCWNVYAGAGTPLHTEGVLKNEAWPYFDSYNIHSYSPPERYLSDFAPAREAACGKPVWLTECGIRLNADPDRPFADLKPEDALRQAEFVARSLASSLFAGTRRHFFFILGNYLEHGIQFGALRHDQTPRPAYVALAAVARFLAGAECLGRVRGDGNSEMVVFRAVPDGGVRCVAVAWAAAMTPLVLPSPVRAEGIFDCFGRPAPPSVGPRPIFVILPTEAAGHLALEMSAPRSAPRDGAASPVVIQAEFPYDATVLEHQGHRVALGRDVAVPLWLYNFGESPVEGKLVVGAPDAWRVSVSRDKLTLAPEGRDGIRLIANLPASGKAGLQGDWITVRGEFGQCGRPVCAFRLCGDARDLVPASTHAIASATNHLAWAKNSTPGSKIKAEAGADGAVIFTVDFGDSDPWAYPFLNLGTDEIPEDSFDGVQVTVHLLEGKGILRAQFVEASGAAYIAGFDAPRDARQPQRLTALFQDATWGTHSKKDPSGKLEPKNIQRLMIGINAERDSRVRLLIRDPRWVRF